MNRALSVTGCIAFADTNQGWLTPALSNAAFGA